MVVPEVGQAAEMASREIRRQLAVASRVMRRRWWAKELPLAPGVKKKDNSKLKGYAPRLRLELWDPI